MILEGDISDIYREDMADLIVEYQGDPTAFEAFPDATVHIISYLHAVVHIPVARIAELAILEFGYSAMPTLFGLISETSLEASGVRRLRNMPAFNLRGQGVLIGIIDTGIDYTNPIFRYADGTTRIAAIWDQTIQSPVPPESVQYGTEYTREQINAALLSDNPFEIVPSIDDIGHGTMLAGVAGGNEVPENNFYGIAADAEFVVVRLKQAKQYLRSFFQIPEGVPCYQENDILFALNYVLNFTYLIRRPLALVIAVGSSQGSHTGRSILSNYLSLYAVIPNIAVVVAAGNEGNARRHYFNVTDPVTRQDIVELNVGENEGGFAMELWGAPPSIFSIDILSPTGEYVPRIEARLAENREITFIFELTAIYVDYQMVEGQSGDQLILVRFVNPTPGIWRFTVYDRGDLNMGFHIWLPMGNFLSDATYFIRSDPYTTLLSMANSIIPITATAYNPIDNSLYLDASRGFTRAGTIKPEIAAPGVNVVGPTLDQGFMEFTGTSVAAAHTVGIAALLMEWGEVRGLLPGISTVEIKKLMIRGARRDINILYPNRDWGYGILDVFNIFDALRTGLVV